MGYVLTKTWLYFSDIYRWWNHSEGNPTRPTTTFIHRKIVGTHWLNSSLALNCSILFSPNIISRVKETGAFDHSPHQEPNHVIMNEVKCLIIAGTALTESQYLPGQGIMVRFENFFWNKVLILDDSHTKMAQSIIQWSPQSPSAHMPFSIIIGITQKAMTLAPCPPGRASQSTWSQFCLSFWSLEVW